MLYYVAHSGQYEDRTPFYVCRSLDAAKAICQSSYAGKPLVWHEKEPWNKASPVDGWFACQRDEYYEIHAVEGDG